MYTFQINLFSFLASLVAKKTNLPTTTHKNKNSIFKEKETNETPSEHDLSSEQEKNFIYYLPIHLM